MSFDFICVFFLNYFSFLEEFSEIFSYVHTGLHGKYPLFLSGLNGTWIFSTDFGKILNYQGKSGGAVTWGTALQAGRSRVRFPIFHWHNPSSRTVALGSTQPLIVMITRNISWGGGVKVGQCVELTTLPPSYADRLEIWERQPPGTLRACPGPYIYRFALPQLSSFMKILCSGSGIVSCGRTDRHDEALVLLRLTVICSFRLKISSWHQRPSHPGTKLTFRHSGDPTTVTVCFSDNISTTKHSYHLWI